MEFIVIQKTNCNLSATRKTADGESGFKPPDASGEKAREPWVVNGAQMEAKCGY